jgi:LmbE family N-acetylglucosaminyl deacetylase
MFRRLALSLVVSALVASSSAAQVGGPLQPPTTGGLPVLLQELRMLGHQKRVLMIGAHPDDEDTDLLVMLTRREGAEAAYLSLTRGEGGQNLIGSELGEALGILRTEELMAARNIDGAQQFFTRAYDFGFSKTLDDTWAHWPKDSVLKDVVRIVRRFRPQVIVAVFSGTPRDGHGQHQASGWAAQEAFRIAGDATRFPELKTEEGLEPFTPTKLYIEAWFNPSAATLTLDGGEVEKLSGKTYHQLAMMGRSLHRSQDMGRLQEFGPNLSRLTFKESRTASADVGAGWTAFWSGVDTVLKAPAEHFAALAEARAAAGRDPIAVGAALDRADQTLQPGARPLVDVIAEEYRGHLARARSTVAWLFVDGVAARSRFAVGEQVEVVFTARNAGRQALRDMNWLAFAREIVTSPDRTSGVTLDPGATAEFRARFTPPVGSRPSTPYYMLAPREGDLYRWPSGERITRGAPRSWEEVRGGMFQAGSGSILDAGPLRSFVGGSERIRDQANGEVRHPVVIVPRIGVKLTPGVAVVRTSATGDARVVRADVTLESGLTSAVSGTVTIEVPNGWPKPVPVPFTLAAGAAAHVAIRVAVPTGVDDGQYPIRAVATDGAGQRYDVGAFTVDYPHIRQQQYTKPSTARIEVIELTPPLARRVAYVRGAADRVPEALGAAGLQVTLLDSVQLSSGDLSGYDAIVIGPRAYEIDSALVRNNGRLLDYARNGGRLIVQYQQQVYLEGGFAPFTLGGNSRITDENAPVTMLGATPAQSALAPLFRNPNAIGPEDWQGWIQERALYCPTNWGEGLNPLLAMNDPGEAPIRGCLLEGKVGRGSYVYTGISFFRELPAGVPGAYRLFFNLLGGSATP